MLEMKGIDAVAKKNCFRFIFVTNEKFSVPATQSERRFFAVKVSNRYQNDKAYFEKLYTAMAEGEIEHFFHYLKTLKFDKRDVLSPPKSAALFEDVYAGMDASDKWLYDLINEWAYNSDESHIYFDKRIPTESLHRMYEEYVENAKKLGRYVKAELVWNQNTLTRRLAKYGFKKTKIDNKQAFYIPGEAACKALFEAKCTCEVTWDAPDPAISINPLDFFEKPKAKEPEKTNPIIEDHFGDDEEKDALLEELRQLGN